MLSFVAAVAEASTVKSSAEVIVKSFPALKDPATLTVLELSASATIAAIEGITSPDGRVLGKMGHSERIGKGLYKNVPGVFEMGMFQSAVEYFK